MSGKSEHSPGAGEPPGDGLEKGLLSQEASGGPTADAGFEFQRAYLLILLLDSLPDPAFTAILNEGMEDVEIRFDRQGTVQRRAIQLKNYRVTKAKARTILGRWAQWYKGSPESWTGFTIACGELDDALGVVQGALDRYRPVSGFHDQDGKPLSETRAEARARIQALDAEMPDDLVEFVLERVSLERDSSYGVQATVRARALDLLQDPQGINRDQQIDRDAAEEIYLRLHELIRGSTGIPITRPQIERITGNVRARAGARLDYQGKVNRVLEYLEGGVLVSQGAPRIRFQRRSAYTHILEEHKRFAGREQAQAQIARFLAGPGGYLFVEGPSGYGKTALLANLVNSNRDACQYHFFSRRDGTEFVKERPFQENLAQQLLAHHGVGGRLPQSVFELRSLCVELLKTPAPVGRPVVVVIDALDETGPPLDEDGRPLGPPRWSLRPYFVELGAGVHVIFSASPVADQDWLQELGLQANSVERLCLGAMERTEMQAMLHQSGNRAAEWSKDPALLRDLETVTGGEPFFLRVLMDDFGNEPEEARCQVRDLAEAIRQEKARNPALQHEGLRRYLGQWWDEVKRKIGAAPVANLLGYLSVALGPLSRDDLILVSCDDALTGETIDVALEAVQRFVVGNDREGYALCHPRFQAYVADQIKDRVASYRQALLAHCARWQEQDPPSRYALTYYPAHLAEAGQTEGLYRLLSRPWMKAKIAMFGSHLRFSEDVALAIDVSGQSPVQWDDLIGGCLISASLRTLADEVSLGEIGASAESGKPDRLAQAEDWIKLKTDKGAQRDSYLQVAEVLLRQDRTGEAAKMLEHALEADRAKTSADGRSTAGPRGTDAQPMAQAGDKAALSRLVPPGQLYGVSGAEVPEAKPAMTSAQSLGLVGDLVGLGAAEAEMGAEGPQMPLEGDVQALKGVGEEEARLEVAQQWLGAARGITDLDSKKRVLGGVTLLLKETADKEHIVELAGHLQEVAEAIPDDGPKALALSRVAQALMLAGAREDAARVARQALLVAKAIVDEQSRAGALSTVARVLAEAGDQAGLRDALELAQAIRSAGPRAEALGGVAQAQIHAGDQQAALRTAQQAQEAAEVISHQRSRARALTAAAEAHALAAQPDRARSLLVEAFKSAGAAGRPCFLAVLEQSAAILAAMDGGKTLGRVYDELIAVEAWWSG